MRVCVGLLKLTLYLDQLMQAGQLQQCAISECYADLSQYMG